MEIGSVLAPNWLEWMPHDSPVHTNECREDEYCNCTSSNSASITRTTVFV